MSYAITLLILAACYGALVNGFYPSGSIHLDRTEDQRPAPRLWNAVDRPATQP